MEHIGKILTLCKGILWMAAVVKANKKRCRSLAERVKALQELVETFQERGLDRISSTVNRALWNLSMTLTKADELVRKCTKTKFLNLLKSKSDFKSVNESLSNTFQVLSGALQVEQGSMMRRMFQAFTVDEDDDDYSGAMAPIPYSGAMAPIPYSGAMAPIPYSGAMAPIPYSGAMAPIPYSGAMAPVHYPAAAAPRVQPTTAVYAAAMGVENDTLFIAEAFFLAQ